jgi:hypothetical protein
VKKPKEFKKGECYLSFSYWITGGISGSDETMEEHITVIEFLEVSPSKKYANILIDNQDNSDVSACWCSIKEIKSLWFNRKWEKVK